MIFFQHFMQKVYHFLSLPVYPTCGTSYFVIFSICMFIVFTEDKVKKNSIYQNLTIHLHNINKLSYKNMIIFHIVLIWLGYNEHLMQTSVSLMSSVSKSMSNTPAILKQRRCSQTVCCVSIHFTYKHENIFGSCGPSYTDSYG